MNPDRLSAPVRIITTEERAKGVFRNEDLPWERRDHALFVGYAPHDSPRYAVSVVVEHGGGGSTAAARWRGFDLSVDEPVGDDGRIRAGDGRGTRPFFQSSMGYRRVGRRGTPASLRLRLRSASTCLSFPMPRIISAALVRSKERLRGRRS